MAKEVGCPTSSSQEVVSCLRQKPARVLSDAQTKVSTCVQMAEGQSLVFSKWKNKAWGEMRSAQATQHTVDLASDQLELNCHPDPSPMRGPQATRDQVWVLKVSAPQISHLQRRSSDAHPIKGEDRTKEPRAGMVVGTPSGHSHAH